MIITEKCTEYDAKVLVLILWQKLSELWVNIVFDETREVDIERHDELEELDVNKL